MPEPADARRQSGDPHPGNDALAPEDAWETHCPKREDGWHCEHWYDEQSCCACGDDTKESDNG